MSAQPPPPDPRIFLERISTHFPELNWTSFQHISEGWDHDVIMLDEAIIFRFPNDEEYLALLPHEVAFLRDLSSQVSVAIPQYRYIAPDSGFAGYPIIPGKQIRKAVFDALDPVAQREIAQQLASFLSVMHTYIAKGHHVSEVVRSYMEDDIADVRRNAAHHLPSVLTPQEFEQVTTILADIDRVVAQELPSVLIHGDIYHSHLIWDAHTSRLGVIDFSDMAFGDPAFDFAELYEYGTTFVEAVYEHYTAPKDPTFLRRAWTYQRWMGVYMMVDYFLYAKTSFIEARETFDRVKDSLLPPK